MPIQLLERLSKQEQYVILAVVVILILFYYNRYAKNSGTASSLLLFYSPSCPACVSFKPNWDAFKLAMQGNKISITEFNVTNPNVQAQIQPYKITAVPTLLAVQSNGETISKYVGDRSVDSLLAWVGTLP